jgi:hypothetical protein
MAFKDPKEGDVALGVVCHHYYSFCRYENDKWNAVGRNEEPDHIVESKVLAKAKVVCDVETLGLKTNDVVEGIKHNNIFFIPWKLPCLGVLFEDEFKEIVGG